VENGGLSSFLILIGDLSTPHSSRDMEVHGGRIWKKNKMKKGPKLRLPLSAERWLEWHVPSIRLVTEFG